MSWWNPEGAPEVEKSVEWTAKLLLGTLATWMASQARSRWIKRSQQEAVAKEILGNYPNSTGNLRDLVEETRDQVNRSMAVRETQDKNTKERIDDLRDDMNALRVEVSSNLNSMRTEQGEREDRQERRINGFMEEIRNLARTYSSRKQ